MLIVYTCDWVHSDCCGYCVCRVCDKCSLWSCRHRGWLARRLSYVLFVLERDVQKDMFARNVVDNVLNNSRYHRETQGEGGMERGGWREKGTSRDLEEETMDHDYSVNYFLISFWTDFIDLKTNQPLVSSLMYLYQRSWQKGDHVLVHSQRDKADNSHEFNSAFYNSNFPWTVPLKLSSWA